ncbi:hypothetical protein [Nocardia gipuzkoensis]|uniref:hypothetical protein n=1 Tax=Nocardia gipuzkoensis TaxID=2749991 RepID=UPI003EDFE881
MPTQSLAHYKLVALSDEAGHQTPTVPFTIEQTHTVMRYHVDCRARRSLTKAAALETSADAGAILAAGLTPCLFSAALAAGATNSQRTRQG